MAAHVPGIIVLALGAGALGGPDALRVLLAFTGQSPLVDIAVCFFVVAMITAQLLGAMLLARFVLTGAGSGRGAPPGRAGAGAGRGAPGADPFAQMSLLVSLAVTFLVTACLLVAVSGGLGSARLPTVYLSGLPLVALCLLLATPFVAPGGLDALRLFPGFTNMFAAATVAGSTLLVWFFSRGGGGGAA